MPLNDKILIFIPMYQCERQIPRVLEKIYSLGTNQSLFTEILIVDNRSNDRSVEMAIKAVKKLSVCSKVIRNCENNFLGGSHKVAFNYALEQQYDYVIVLHGDDQGDIRDLIPYILNGTYKSFDSLLGSRFEKESKLVNYSKFRIFGNHVFNLFISFCIQNKITDMGSGLNLYSRDFLQDRAYMFFPNNLTFNVYLLLYSFYVKSNIKFFPLSWREEDQVSNAKLFAQSKEILGLTIKYLLNAKDLFSFTENAYSQKEYAYEVLFENPDIS